MAKERKPYVRFDEEKQQEFLERVRTHGRLTAAAAEVGVSHDSVYRLRQADVVFAQEVRKAVEIAQDKIAKAAYDRAVHGVEEVQIQKGEVVRWPNGEPVFIKRYSDGLLQTLLKGHFPEYREKSEVTHSVNGHVSIDHTLHGNPTKDFLLSMLEIRDLKLLSREERQEFGALLDKMVTRKERQAEGSEVQGYLEVLPVEDVENV